MQRNKNRCTWNVWGFGHEVDEQAMIKCGNWTLWNQNLQGLDAVELDFVGNEQTWTLRNYGERNKRVTPLLDVQEKKSPVHPLTDKGQKRARAHNSNSAQTTLTTCAKKRMAPEIPRSPNSCTRQP